MANYNGRLNSNEIFSSIFNMLVSQQTFSQNLKNTFSELVDMARVDGGMLGDTRLYYASKILKSVPWGNDAEAANLLEINRPEDPDVQAVTIDVFRAIYLTVDSYMSKRAFADEGAFAQFNSVMLAQIRDTKRLLDATTFNTFIGCEKGEGGKQNVTVKLNAGTEAQDIAKAMADILIDVETPSREYNDYGNYRSYNGKEMIAVWNAAYVNKVTKEKLPTIFHKDGLIDKFGEHVLPAQYFGNVNASGSTTTSDNKTVYALVEKDFGGKHCYPGDRLPNSTAYGPNETYTVDDKIMFKLYYKEAVPFMSGFEVATSFYNPRSLTTTHHLVWSRNTLTHLKNYPFITVKAQ